MFVVTMGFAGGARADTVIYGCEDGTTFNAIFDNSADTLTLVFDGTRVVLRPAISGSGFRYRGGGYELQGKGNRARVDRPGQRALECQDIGRVNTPPQQEAEISFPFQAQSWGGLVRSGPGQQFRKITSLREGEPITVLEQTQQYFQERPWFKIRFRGRVGYQWGGIICPKGRPVPGTYQVCN